MKRMFKAIAAVLGIGLIVIAALAINVVWFRPFDIRIFYEKAFLQFALESPELLSSIRLLESFGIEAHNDELDDVSPEQTRHVNDLILHDLETLHRYDRDALEGQVALSYDVLDWFLQNQADGVEFASHGYPVNQLFGVQNNFPEFMANTHYIGDAGDAEDYIGRLSKLDDKFAGLLADLRQREGKGIVPPRFVIDRVLEEMRGFTATPARENILYTSFAERTAELEDVPTAEREALLGAAEQEIGSTVYSAYAGLIDYFEALRPKVTTDHGAWMLPNGAAWYAWLLRQHTTTDMTPEEVHELGLSEVGRIDAEMDSILRAEGYAEGTVGERMAKLNEEPRFLYPKTPEGRAEVLADYTAIVEEIEARSGELVGKLPRAKVEVVAVPEFREQTAAGAYYQGPSFDGSRPGRFYVNLRDLKEHPRYAMRTLAYHEAIPGHHLQSALQTELEGVAQFRRILPFTAFDEGWGLYAERVAWEAGYQSDPYDNLGRLQAEMMRAVRLVVDTGIHAQRWSREQAIDYMFDKTGIAHHDVVAEIERYFVSPGQATAYKVGMQQFLALRERARETLGPRFDLREFHDFVLGNGALPLTILEQQVEAWIASRREPASS